MKLTVRGFARDIGVQPSFVTDIEAGRRRPGPDTLAKISEVLNLPLEDLEALDPRVSPDVKEWMEHEPRVSSLLRQIRETPNPGATLSHLEDAMREQGDGVEEAKET
jgi:transcriptional regulator with XRE-family HTH domain